MSIPERDEKTYQELNGRRVRLCLDTHCVEGSFKIKLEHNHMLVQIELSRPHGGVWLFPQSTLSQEDLETVRGTGEEGASFELMASQFSHPSRRTG